MLYDSEDVEQVCQEELGHQPEKVDTNDNVVEVSTIAETHWG
jgi:hypothetical protein